MYQLLSWPAVFMASVVVAVSWLFARNTYDKLNFRERGHR